MNALVTPPRVLLDQHGRSKRKLRVSLTDRCNFRCRYCLPETPKWLPKAELLSTDELHRLVSLFVENGIDALRLTGGEPLLRPDLLDCVSRFNGLRTLGLKRISMTTNASRLAPQLAALQAAGLDDLNISLDAITADGFRAMTGSDIAPVLEGIAEAQRLGMPLKLNAVLLRGSNDEQILPLTEWAGARGLTLRFIEFMPLDSTQRWSKAQVMSEDDVLAVLRQRYHVTEQPRSHDPATEFWLDNGQRVGFISTVSKPFCGSCDRLRITARGELYTCLFSETGTPLGASLRAGTDMAELRSALKQAVWNKPAGYEALRAPVERPITMHALGG